MFPQPCHDSREDEKTPRNEIWNEGQQPNTQKNIGRDNEITYYERREGKQPKYDED